MKKSIQAILAIMCSAGGLFASEESCSIIATTTSTTTTTCTPGVDPNCTAGSTNNTYIYESAPPQQTPAYGGLFPYTPFLIYGAATGWGSDGDEYNNTYNRNVDRNANRNVDRNADRSADRQANRGANGDRGRGGGFDDDRGGGRSGGGSRGGGGGGRR